MIPMNKLMEKLTSLYYNVQYIKVGGSRTEIGIIKSNSLVATIASMTDASPINDVQVSLHVPELQAHFKTVIMDLKNDIFKEDEGWIGEVYPNNYQPEVGMIVFNKNLVV